MAMLPRVLLTEFLKIKRTLALWMVVIAPYAVVLLQFLISFASAEQTAKRNVDVWAGIARQTVALWTVLMMPLFLTLETSLLAGVEHSEKNWKSVLALPPPRWTIYAGKLMVTIALLWAAHVMLVTGTLASGYLLRVTRPVLHLDNIRPGLLAWPMVQVSLAALCAVVIQHWVSLRWQSFTAAMAFGMCAMIAGFVAANSSDYGPWVPWSMSMFAIRVGPAMADQATRVLVIALAGAIVFAVAGAIEFSRREIN